MQRTLFDLDDSPVIARPSDPGTSHIAAANVQCRLGHLQAAFVASLVTEGKPLTAREVEVRAVKLLQRCVPDSIRKRAKELVRRGSIVECGQRLCDVSGNLATVYRVNHGNS